MRPSEADWICAVLMTRGAELASPLANIGSSTIEFRTVKKPHIEERLFRPLRDAGFEITNIDVREEPGVDLVGDLTEETFLQRLKGIGFRSAICSNLLEHLADRRPFVAACSDIIAPGGVLVVTVPRCYPYHADPIDTLYRPSPKQLSEEFSKLNPITSHVFSDGNLIDEELSGGVARSSKYILFALLRVLNVVRPKVALAQAHKLLWLFRNFEVSCVVFEKPHQDVCEKGQDQLTK